MFNLIKFSLTKSNRARRLLSVSVNKQYVIIESEKGTMKFPQIWLRDNCDCSECFHANTYSRIYKFKFGVNAKKVTAVNEDLIEVTWNDNHYSSYNLNWLKARDFDCQNIQNYVNFQYRLPYKLWTKCNFEKKCHTFDYTDLKTAEGLRNWIQSVAVYGVALINGAPKSIETVQELAGIIGFVRKTHYGETWVVESKSKANNYAYLSSALPLHTDLPYYEYMPGVNLLHCLSQTHSKGGMSLLADGFYIADRLKQVDLKSYQILKTVPVDWNDVVCDQTAGELHSIYRSPVINLDIERKYYRINFSIPQRDNRFSVPLKLVVPWYHAYAKLVNILNEEILSFKLEENQVLAFNNLRIFHGRTGYQDHEGNVRKVIGAYLDWDIIYAKWRSLEKNCH